MFGIRMIVAGRQDHDGLSAGFERPLMRLVITPLRPARHDREARECEVPPELSRKRQSIRIARSRPDDRDPLGRHRASHRERALTPGYTHGDEPTPVELGLALCLHWRCGTGRRQQRQRAEIVFALGSGGPRVA